MIGRRVVVGVSGGVDSSVSALLLKQSGLFDEVVGVFMRNWEPGDETGDSYTCPAAADFKDASKVCDQIGIKIHKVDFVKEYWNGVFEPYLAKFQQGGTPNPDVFCNKEIKFKAFRDFISREFGSETHVATGHYARLRDQLDPVRHPKLVQAVDQTKDQTYFLCAVPGERFRNVHFPVGEICKTRVREIAKEAGLCTAAKKDSVGICFVGKRSFPEFISEYIDPSPGRFVGVDGSEYGKHAGVNLFTIGQKANISGAPQKLYVAGKDVETGTIFVAPGNHPTLFAKGLEIRHDRMHWIAGQPPLPLLEGGSLACMCRVRYRSDLVPCVINIVEKDNATLPVLQVQFETPQLAVTPEQIAAFYDQDVCLGGGEISGSIPLEEINQFR